MSALTDLLARDPDARRCMRVFAARGDWTVDDLIACYSSRDLARALHVPFGENERSFEEREPSDDELLAGLNALMGTERAPKIVATAAGAITTTELGPPPETSEPRYVLVPEDLISSIERSYAAISQDGERDFEEKLYAWLAEGS